MAQRSFRHVVLAFMLDFSLLRRIASNPRLAICSVHLRSCVGIAVHRDRCGLRFLDDSEYWAIRKANIGYLGR